jgi:ferredoxin
MDKEGPDLLQLLHHFCVRGGGSKEDRGGEGEEYLAQMVAMRSIHSILFRSNRDNFEEHRCMRCRAGIRSSPEGALPVREGEDREGEEIPTSSLIDCRCVIRRTGTSS